MGRVRSLKAGVNRGGPGCGQLLNKGGDGGTRARVREREPGKGRRSRLKGRSRGNRIFNSQDQDMPQREKGENWVIRARAKTQISEEGKRMVRVRKGESVSKTVRKREGGVEKKARDNLKGGGDHSSS